MERNFPNQTQLPDRQARNWKKPNNSAAEQRSARTCPSLFDFRRWSRMMTASTTVQNSSTTIFPKSISWMALSTEGVSLTSFLWKRAILKTNTLAHKFLVATPAGLQRAMDEERQSLLYLEEHAIMVDHWDLTLILKCRSSGDHQELPGLAKLFR